PLAYLICQTRSTGQLRILVPPDMPEFRRERLPLQLSFRVLLQLFQRHSPPARVCHAARRSVPRIPGRTNRIPEGIAGKSSLAVSAPEWVRCRRRPEPSCAPSNPAWQAESNSSRQRREPGIACHPGGNRETFLTHLMVGRVGPPSPFGLALG